MLFGVIEESACQENILGSAAQIADNRDFLACGLIGEDDVPAVFDGFADVTELQRVALGNSVVICLILEGEGENTGVYEVLLVDAGEALNDDRFDAQIQRDESGMLTGRTLSIVCLLYTSRCV